MIPFRTQRLATSVTNRILNLRNDLPPPPALGIPAAPEPVPGGAEISQALAQPVQPVTAEQPLVEEVALTQGRLL